MTQDLVERLRSALAASTEQEAAAAAGGGKIYDMLIASECYLLTAYYTSKDQPAPPCDDTDGVMELGPVLYYLNNPPSKYKEIVDVAVKVLELIEDGPLPSSKISTTLWPLIVAQAKSPGIVAKDGTIYGESQYEQLDPGWLISFGSFLYYQIRSSRIYPFGTPPKEPVPLSPGAESITIGIVGDWGTGPYDSDGGPANRIMTDLQSLSKCPDYLIHLGDVYYAGLGFEEQENLLKYWPAKFGPGKNNAFTLNSNHEMYDGANGYFETALASSGPFATQRGSSYFALTFGDWVILCLDSAYYASADKMYMIGSIGTSEGAQATWIQSNFGSLKGKNVIVMTHHNPMDVTGSVLEGADESTQLWNVVVDALGGAPVYWYFGHTHNGVVYSGTSVLGQSGTLARLCGHGAIPFGKASSLPPVLESGVVEYFSDAPVSGEFPKVYNGFATLELTTSGITENFYELTGTPKAPKLAWSSG